jgi:CheY-like chemotaxis protein
MSPERPLVLIIDDNSADIELTREALMEVDVPLQLESVRDGFEALAYLRRQGSYSDRRRPEIIFLDLNMPRMDGRETLAMLKGEEDITDIPVVVFSTSESPFDIRESYRKHAAAYVTKPVTIEEFIEKLQAIATLWLKGTAAAAARQNRGMMDF